MALDGAARTHPGKQRTTNEDALVCRPAAGLFAVVDGMGGEEAGEVAAAIAVAAIAEVPDLADLAGETVLSQAFHTARERILAEADSDPTKEGMGAVGTALRFDDRGGSVSVAHVGDSRAYLVHAGGVRQLTHDHVAEASPGKKAQVARDLGRRDLRGEWVETSRAKVARGDLIVLCSDGLHDVVGAEELAREFIKLRGEAKSADAIATRLVGMALAAGGPDNVTVVVVRVGRYRRGAGVGGVSRPIWLVLSIFAALAVGGWMWLQGGLRPEALPEIVSGVTELGATAGLSVPAASRTAISGRATFRVSGERISGGDWTLAVAPEGAVQLERVVIALERELVLEVAAGGEVLLRDLRVESGRVRIVAAPGSRVLLEHVRVSEPGALVIEGEGLVSRSDVGLIDAPRVPVEGAP
ncbi:hypothetical protein LBMAG42_39010 [Deltaproteobacteria bacterium]|nr:hypothetical protein LBMAG42_39010 [Deltaproteobacteria bacterium]